MSAPSALHDARRHRAALAGAAGYWSGVSVSLDDLAHDERAEVEEITGKSRGHVLWYAEERTTGTGLRVDGRPVQWRLDLADVARRLALCERAAALRRTVTGEWRPVSLGCGVRLCPVCARLRAARVAVRWRPVLEAAAADGAELRHWTLTHRADAAPGGLTLPREVDRYGWDRTGDVRDLPWVPLGGDEWGPPVAGSVGGESLYSAYDRVLTRWQAMRDDRSTRAATASAWPAAIRGIEWTGRSPRSGVPRWHAHLHVLTVSPRPLSSSEVRAVLDGWRSKAAGAASDRAQRSRIVDEHGIVEVLKYPFKPASLTSAQRVEVLAAARGQKPHQVAGAFHARSRAHNLDPWRRWLAARPAPVWCPRLHYVPRAPHERVDELARGEPELWTGQGIGPGTESERYTWAVRRDGEWERWMAPAAPYLRALRDLPPDEPEAPDDDGDDDDDGQAAAA